jgi:chemotaxis protein CheC
MNNRDLTELQRDALQEITNVGMGKAGASLAHLLKTFVTLSVPRIQLVSVEEFITVLRDADHIANATPLVRQAFQSDISGEAVVFFGPDGRSELRELMGYDDPATGLEHEMLSDVANLLVGACVRSIFEQLGRSLSFSAPTFVDASTWLDLPERVKTAHWEVALLLHVHFRLETGGFVAQLAMLLPDNAITRMTIALDTVLDTL